MGRGASKIPVNRATRLEGTDVFSLVLGSTDKIWINDDGDGALYIGGSAKGSAPFSVAADGTLVATGATIKNAASGDRVELSADGLVLVQSTKFGGDKTLSFKRGSGEIMVSMGLDDFSLGLPGTFLLDTKVGSNDLVVRINSLYTRFTGDGLLIDETTSTGPPVLNADSECAVYLKALAGGNVLIIKFNDGGTTRYKYLPLSGTSVTWVHSTTEPT